MRGRLTEAVLPRPPFICHQHLFTSAFHFLPGLFAFLLVCFEVCGREYFLLSVAHLSRAFGEHTCFILIKSNLPFLLLSHFWHQVCVLFVYSQVLNIIYPVVSELLQFQSAAHVDSIFV